MTKNEIIGRLRDAGLDASSTNRNAAVYVTDAVGRRSNPGWFGFRIVCDSEATERRVRQVLSRWYDIEVSGDVWMLKSNRRQPVMAIKRGGAPTPTSDYLYFEAAEANSTISLMSMLTTAPNLEYSTDGVNFQEWQQTTVDDTHTFDTITLGEIGDHVYLRGNNPNGLGAIVEGQEMPNFTNFVIDGSVSAGGNIMSLLDKTMELTEVPDYGFMNLFAVMGEGLEPVLLTPPSMDTITAIGDNGCAEMYCDCTSLTTAADMPALTSIGEGGCIEMYCGCTSLTTAADMPALTSIGEGGCDSMYYNCTSLTTAVAMPALTTIGVSGCAGMYFGCTSLTAAADMPALTSIGENGCDSMYYNCTFNMSDDGTTLNFAFPTPPVTAGSTTYQTAYDVADCMGNTNGF